MPIHIKLAAALMVPLIALVVVAVVEVAQATREADRISKEAAVVKAATGPSGLFNNLMDERNRSGLWLIGQADWFELPCPDVESCRAETDRSLSRFKGQIESEGGELEAVYADAFAKLEGLADLRASIDANPGPYDIPTNQEAAREAFRSYADIITSLFESNARVTVAVDDPELRRGADLGYAAARNTDYIAHIVQRLLSAMASDGGLDTNAEISEVAGLFGLSERNYQDIQDMATGDYAAAGEKLRIDSESTGFRELVPEFIETGDVDMDRLLNSVSVPRDFSYYGFKASVTRITEAKADDLEAGAQQRARLFMALAAVALAIATMATWLVSRSITRPLRALTRQATDMANHRLPDAVLDILDTPLGDDVTVPGVEPIHVQTRDEVADVADALNTVQDSALDLAVEQAVLRRNIADSFVNLGRRNQNLLGRQLDFITELEHNETDPDTLANLFRLDHLATRMRRNAESLLVLAGIDPPRKWAAPVRITDAIRAALGEVEDYQRITVRAVEPATVLGSAAADLAHLLAELIENSLIFSPPDQIVEIRGRAQPSGYTLAVIDSGLGMPPEELARANRRLAGAESFTIAPSKYLGHYVAGNLAARHNINVTLHNSPGHGITATINLPPTLLTADGTSSVDTAAGAPELQTELPASLLPVDSPDALAGVGAPADLAAIASATPPNGLLPSQTTGGLAKRQPRQPGQPSRPTTIPAAAPDDELLQTLSQYTTHLHDQPPPPIGGVPAESTPPPIPPAGHVESSTLPHFLLTPPPGIPAIRDRGPAPEPLPPMPPPLPQRDEVAMPAPPLARRGGPDVPPAPPLARRGDQEQPFAPPSANPLPPISPLPPVAPSAPSAPSSPPPTPRPPLTGPGIGNAPTPFAPPGTPPAAPPSPFPSRPPVTPPGLPQRPAAAADDGGMAPQTPGGLTRRVRGAQLPMTEMVSLRRGNAAAGGTPPGPAPQAPGAAPEPFQQRRKASSAPQPAPRRLAGRDPNTPYRSPWATDPYDRKGTPAEPEPVEPAPPPPPLPPFASAPSADSGNGDHKAADEVYGFLSSFTAGVQRGLDESRNPPDGDDPDGES